MEATGGKREDSSVQNGGSDLNSESGGVLSLTFVSENEADTRGLILHTTVTIGYDTPWRRVHELLVQAALTTPHVLAEPRPFVWQTALNDFYVSYEINAYTASARDMVETYALLHAQIQDEFDMAGVEIMSPHYTAVRDGNAVTIPEAFRSPGYRAPAFRLEDLTRQGGRYGNGDRVEVSRRRRSE